MFQLDHLHLHETNRLKHKNKQISGQIPPVQVIKSNEKHHRHKQNSNYIPVGSQVLKQVQQVSMDSISPAILTVHEKVQQVLPDSTTPASQVAHEQVQQESQLPTTPASQAVHEQIQQDRQDSTNLEANDQSEEQDPSTNKRKRGGTRMQRVHGWSERKLIMQNELGQPIGPTKDVVTELGSFLGTLARNGTFCPLNVFNWKKLKTHDDMWDYIQEKYNIPDAGKEWAMTGIQLAWRGHKTRLKKKYFYAYANDEIQMAKRPRTVPESAFEDIIKYWNSKEAKDTSSTNKENRKKLRYPHTIGKTSFAIIREEKNKETPNALSNKDVFVATRRRKPGRVYKDSYEDTTNKIVEMERMETQESENGTQSSVDTFAAVMGPDHPGRVRLYERGVTKTLLKKKGGDSGPSSNVVDDEMVQKRMDEIEERIQQIILEKFNAQKDSIERDVTMNIIAQLQRLNPGLTLDPDMLRFSVRSPGEEATVQPINRPSAGSNNQGVEMKEGKKKSVMTILLEKTFELLIDVLIFILLTSTF